MGQATRDVTEAAIVSKLFSGFILLDGDFNVHLAGNLSRLKMFKTIFFEIGNIWKVLPPGPCKLEVLREAIGIADVAPSRVHLFDSPFPEMTIFLTTQDSTIPVIKL